MLNLDNSGSVFNQDIKLQKTGIAMDRTPKCVFFFGRMSLNNNASAIVLCFLLLSDTLQARFLCLP